MTYEQAAYFRLLILCGYRDELNKFIDDALAEQNPLSNVILDLSSAGLDDKKTLSALNEFLRQREASIDWDHSVFDMIMEFLRKQCIYVGLPMKRVTDLMYQLAVCTDRYDAEPWSTMYYMGDLFSEAEAGYIDKADFRRKFDGFITQGICLSDYTPVSTKESIIKTILRWLRGMN